MTEDDFIDEFEPLLEQAGIENATIEFTDEVRTSPRSYAAVEPYDDVPHFLFAPEVLELPEAHRRGLIMHEIGHVLCAHLPNGGTEDDADEYALAAFGEKILYDHNWPGKGLQYVATENPAPPEGLSHEIATHHQGDFSVYVYDDKYPVRRADKTRRRKVGMLRAALFDEGDDTIYYINSASVQRPGKGIGRYMYRVAAQEAEKRGGHLCSDPHSRSDQADNFWNAEVKRGLVFRDEYDLPEEELYDIDLDCYDEPAPGPRENPAPANVYQTKKEAVKAFLDHNYYTGLDFDYDYGPEAFDNINDIIGAQVRTIRGAVEAAIPTGRPYDLADIDLDLLNDADVVRRAQVNFSLPPEAEVRRQYKELYGDDYERIMEPPQSRPLTPAERVKKTAKLISSFIRKNATPAQKLGGEIEVVELAELPARGLKPSFQQLIYTLNNELRAVEDKVTGYRLEYVPPRTEKRDYRRTRGDVSVTLPASLRFWKGARPTQFHKTPSRRRP